MTRNQPTRQTRSRTRIRDNGGSIITVSFNKQVTEALDHLVRSGFAKDKSAAIRLSIIQAAAPVEAK